MGWAAAATRAGEVYMTNSKTMVDNVLKTLGDNSSISRLNILDHGNEFTIEIGDDILSKETISNYVPILSRLRGHFTRDGIVHIQHCDAGQNKDLICAIAAAFGVTVYAGTGAHNPVLRFNFGYYVKCSPGGKFETHVSRP